MFLPARGRLRLAEGRLRDGLTDLLACGERHETNTNRSPALWSWRSDSALALEALGDHERALELSTAELALARELGAPRALGVALRACGLVAGGERGLSLLSEAGEVLARSPARLERARALADLGAALRRAGRRTDARVPLREAQHLASQCGAVVLGRRIDEELVASGAHPNRALRHGPEALTSSELRVARMAAAGRSNPEIAQALFLTRRTVETHLTHVYQKLGIRSRSEIGSALTAPAPRHTQLP